MPARLIAPELLQPVWWASAQWKLGLSYGLANLDKGGVRGKTDMVLFRFQWLD